MIGQAEAITVIFGTNAIHAIQNYASAHQKQIGAPRHQFDDDAEDSVAPLNLDFQQPLPSRLTDTRYDSALNVAPKSKPS